MHTQTLSLQVGKNRASRYFYVQGEYLFRIPV